MIKLWLFKIVGIMFSLVLFVPGFLAGCLLGMVGYGFMLGWDAVVSTLNKTGTPIFSRRTEESSTRYSRSAR